MQHERKTVKGNNITYNKKDGKVNKINKYLNLGVNSLFNVDDEVIIISADDFDSIATADAPTPDDKSLLDEISKLEKTIEDKDNEIKQLKDSYSKLNDSVDEVKALLLSKDSTIDELEKKLVKYDAVDVDEFKEKLTSLNKQNDDLNSELRKSNKIIMMLQNQKMEYKDLVNYNIRIADAYKNQGMLNKLLGRDATAEIIKPNLKLLDESGNVIADKKDAEIETKHSRTSKK